jgi:hypothetical protein
MISLYLHVHACVQCYIHDLIVPACTCMLLSLCMHVGVQCIIYDLDVHACYSVHVRAYMCMHGMLVLSYYLNVYSRMSDPLVRIIGSIP